MFTHNWCLQYLTEQYATSAASEHYSRHHTARTVLQHKARGINNAGHPRSVLENFRLAGKEYSCVHKDRFRECFSEENKTGRV
jgi:hypothetical protein